MRSLELKRRFFEFFQRREHVLIPPAQIIFDNQKKLLVSSGIESFEKYFKSEINPLSDLEPRLGKPIGALNTVSSQYCFRPEDAENVGDDSHLTFFEMLGAYTFGGYKKQTAIKITSDFFKNLNLFIDYVTVFGGSAGPSSDKDTEYMWKELGITYIQRLGLKENFWGPMGANAPAGPGTGGVCGPTSEIYIKDMGIWSIVFLDYFFSGSHQELISKNNLGGIERLNTRGLAIVTGLERLTAAANGKSNVFETDIFESLFLPLQNTGLAERQKRIAADHIRAVCFVINEGSLSGRNSPEFLAQTGFQSLLRRIFVYEKLMKLPEGLFEEISEKTVHLYNSDFKNPSNSIKIINDTIKKERAGFAEAMNEGLKELSKIKSGHKSIDARTAFYVFEKFGLPFESVKEFGGPAAKNLTREDFFAEGGEKELIIRGLAFGKKPEEKKGISSRIKELWNKIP